MYPYQHGGEENLGQQGESENNPSDTGRDTDADFETQVMSELQAFLNNHNNNEQPSGDRHSRPLEDPNDGEQASGDRHSRPLEDPNDVEQASGDRHSRPLEDPNDVEQALGDRHLRPLEDPKDGEQPSGDEHSESEAGSDPLARNGQKKLASVRGETKGKDETLMYLQGGKWVPAVYHDAVRHYLIKEANKHGEYDHPRERGIEPDNVTSFLESQKSWGPVRDENWADILYVFEKKKNIPRIDDPVNWKVGERVILAGRDSRPILAYNDIPATLSTQLAGRDMEAIKRTDPRIRQRDFIARMPMKYTTRTGKRRNARSASWIGMEMTRFRQRQGMLSWVGREGSDVIRNALWNRLPIENKERNTIRGLAPPSAWEQEKVREGNVGKFTKNAGVRALPDDERAKRQQLKEQRQLLKSGTTSGVDGMAGRDGGRRRRGRGRGQHAQERGATNKRPRPDFPDNTTRQDRGQKDGESGDESDKAPPKDGTRQRISPPSLRHRPRGHREKSRERLSASGDRCMQPPENPLTPAPVNYFELEPQSPPDYEAYLERQARQRKAAQEAYK